MPPAEGGEVSEEWSSGDEVLLVAVKSFGAAAGYWREDLRSGPRRA